MNKEFPKKISVFPLRGAIFFPKTNLPLNIFEKRYVSMVEDALKGNKYIGMVQSKKVEGEVFKVGCLGKIDRHEKTPDGRILINLNGLSRFKIDEEVNNDIEKRIFLQIMDFLWRSHLQYLEQLRQVIGLRSYGQKDPLAEFRREAFQLFEDLLFKIKTETIKFLINTNIVIQDKKEDKQTGNFVKTQKISRNEPCSCGSGKKYKHCHGKVA